MGFPSESVSLTIGMAAHDDYDGCWFTIQAIRLYHPKFSRPWTSASPLGPAS